MRELFLYSRENCCLCDDMHAELTALLRGRDVMCHVIKIDGDPVLEQRYGARVPVLTVDDNELCEIRLNASAVKAYLGLSN